MNEKYIQSLRDLIQKTHKCPCRYSQSSPIKEEADGKILWEGTVELFDLGGHPTARHCYAWAQKDATGRLQFTTILKTPEIDSPRKAVQSTLGPPSESRP